MTWLDPTPIFHIPFHGATWWLSAEFDATTLVRIGLSPILTFPFLLIRKAPWLCFWYFFTELGSFLHAGAGSVGCVDLGCTHGANLIDLGGAIWTLPLVIIAYHAVARTYNNYNWSQQRG